MRGEDAFCGGCYRAGEARWRMAGNAASPGDAQRTVDPPKAPRCDGGVGVRVHVQYVVQATQFYHGCERMGE